MDCSECIFAQQVVSSGGPLGGPQIGCLANRIDILKEKGKAKLGENGYYELKQFCNMYRESDWASHYDGNHLEKAKNQAKVKFGVLVLDSPDCKWEDTESTMISLLESIKHYDNRCACVVISCGIDKTANHVMNIIDRFRDAGLDCESITHRFLFDQQMREKEAFQKIADKDFFLKLLPGSSVPAETFEKINQSINEKLEQTIVFESDGHLILQKYAVNNMYLKFKDYDDMSASLKKFAILEDKYKRVA